MNVGVVCTADAASRAVTVLWQFSPFWSMAFGVTSPMGVVFSAYVTG